MNLKLKLGTNDAFDCPEGKYRAVLETIGAPKKRINRPCQEQVRAMFRVKDSPGKGHLVARTFCADLSYGSELYNFVESWLDGNFEALLNDSRELDLNLLLGREADLLITHWDDGAHDKPFVKIAGIFPPGKLVE